MLTEAGRDFVPILHVLGAWGARHFGEGEVSHYVDAATGERVRPAVVDAASGAPLGSRPLRLVAPGEGAAPRRSWVME